MNTIMVAGNIGKDAELRHTPSGDAVASFSVADNQGRDRQTIWWNCSVWGKRAQALAPYLLKGQQITVVGTVSEREWADRDGNARKSMDVRVNEIALQGGKRDEQPRPAPAPAPRPVASAQQAVDDDQDIPFANPYRGRLAFVV